MPDALEVPDYSQYIKGEKWMGLSPLPAVESDGDRQGAVELHCGPRKHEEHPGRVWDGFSRQDENGEGPVFFFRPLHSEEKRKTFKIPWVKKDWHYKVSMAPKNETIGQFTGKELIEKGIEVEIKRKRDAKVLLFEKI